MGRDKRTAPGVGAGDHAKERHRRDRRVTRVNPIDWSAPLPPGLVARPEKPKISSKHKSWFEFIENKDKKKKLEFEVTGFAPVHRQPSATQRTDSKQFTTKREPPPGFEFVPIGNPALTTACKELSREQGAMIFIVTVCEHHLLSVQTSLTLTLAASHLPRVFRRDSASTLIGSGIIFGRPSWTKHARPSGIASWALRARHPASLSQSRRSKRISTDRLTQL
jgi:hypothetical protein